MPKFTTCTLPGCDRPHKGHGYCNLHYQRFKKYGHPGESAPRLVKTHRNTGPCSVDGCTELRFCKGLCTLHYSRMRGHGDPEYVPAKRVKQPLPSLVCHWDGCQAEARRRIFCEQHAAAWNKANPVPRTAPADERLYLRTTRRGDCLYFTGPLNVSYYGTATLDGRNILAHRLSWRAANGWAEIPADKVVDHFECHTPYCVEPSHLRLATRVENTHNRRGANRENATGKRGVTWYPQGKKWNARYELNGTPYNLGFFDDEDEAHAALREHRGAAYRALGWDFDGEVAA